MSAIFGDIEQFAVDLYPYRWPITAGLIIAVLLALYLAYRRRWHLVAWRHRLATAVVAAVLLAVAIPAGNYFLSPLWERSHLEEASPLASAAGDGGPTANLTPIPAPAATPVPSPEPTQPAFTPHVTHSGDFHGADDFHFGRGKALLIETAPGQYTLRFEEFSVRNGPDLFVYLSPNPDGYDDGALNLGGLKATDGAFNYEVPPDTDISQFNSAVVWCRQFSVLFATAPLAPGP